MHADIAAFVEGYAFALIWQSTDIVTMEPVKGTPEDLGVDGWAVILADVGPFLGDAAPLIRSAVATSDAYTWEIAGHDFALSRNGHGAGYWDRGLGETGDMLHAIAKPYGESSAYRTGTVLEVFA